MTAPGQRVIVRRVFVKETEKTPAIGLLAGDRARDRGCGGADQRELESSRPMAEAAGRLEAVDLIIDAVLACHVGRYTQMIAHRLTIRH